MNPWKRGIVLGVILAVGFFAVIGLYRGAGRVQDAVYQTDSRNNLLQISYAIHNFESNYRELPCNTYGPDGKPLLSWRVHLLPLLEEDALYRQFRLDEPWDSPTNIRLLKHMPRVYARPMDRPGMQGIYTYYRGFSSPGAVFERRPGDVPTERVAIFGITVHPPARFRLGSVKDGPSNTIFVVEAGEPVEWTKPDDLDTSPSKPFPKLGGFGWKDEFQAVMGDVRVRSFRLDTPEDKLRALVTHSGGEPVAPD
jgi:hypothetical protein